MSEYICPKYKIRIDPDSHKTQGLQAGDIVWRQYVARDRSVYSLMAVLESGVDVISGKDSPYFVGALLDGDEPCSGELLDFVRLTSLCDLSRSGALYLTATDDQAPYMDVIDGMATERSLCFPVQDGGTVDIPDKTKYAVFGEGIAAEYRASAPGAESIMRMTCLTAVDGTRGLKQTLEENVDHPERLLVSFRARASAGTGSMALKFGYTNGEKYDAQGTVTVSSDWEFKLWVCTVEYPGRYSRSLTIDCRTLLDKAGNWCEVADLNIIRLSSVSVFTGATKGRVGKLSGIVDPVFGLLDGYGAYFQNLYATRNVNIAGTLTAGDERGFSSTFYVGRIHKNVLLDSLSCAFSGSRQVEETSPAGIGRCVLVETDSSLYAQSGEWRSAHLGQPCCFSLWIRSEESGIIRFYQDEHLLVSLEVAPADGWIRHKMSFLLRPSDNPQLSIVLSTSFPVLLSAPQLELGTTSSPYQATDEVLNDTDDYGAWFNRGGIGGTIQHPLLSLNEDGSIVSRDGSFVINPDGTGHFAGGRFKWTRDTIELRGVTIRWEDFDEETQELLKPRSVSLTGGSAFHYSDTLVPDAEPAQITLVAVEYNFEPESRLWEYLASDGAWKDAGSRSSLFEMTPAFHGWEGRDTLTLRYTAIAGTEKICATHTFFKLYDGDSSYTVYVESENGTTFRNGIVSTTLRARVYRGGEEITEQIPDGNFHWMRVSSDSQADALWNSGQHEGRELEISGDDVWRKAVFDCEVIISNKIK